MRSLNLTNTTYKPSASPNEQPIAMGVQSQRQGLLPRVLGLKQRKLRLKRRKLRLKRRKLRLRKRVHNKSDCSQQGAPSWWWLAVNCKPTHQKFKQTLPLAERSVLKARTTMPLALHS